VCTVTGLLSSARRAATRQASCNVATLTGAEVSPNLGDGLTDQAAAVWDFEGTELATTSIPLVNVAP
jgi:hypothetical protein